MRRPELLSLVLSLPCVLAVLTVGRAAEPPVDFTGKWHGTWKSCDTGHHGPLNAQFCKSSDTCYQVRFSGRFFVALPFVFRVPLQVTGQEGGTVFLAGSPHLPLFGTYHFSAVATHCKFTATYSARNDHGQFTLSR